MRIEVRIKVRIETHLQRVYSRQQRVYKRQKMCRTAQTNKELLPRKGAAGKHSALQAYYKTVTGSIGGGRRRSGYI